MAAAAPRHCGRATPEWMGRSSSVSRAAVRARHFGNEPRGNHTGVDDQGGGEVFFLDEERGDAPAEALSGRWASRAGRSGARTRSSAGLRVWSTRREEESSRCRHSVKSGEPGVGNRRLSAGACES